MVETVTTQKAIEGLSKLISPHGGTLINKIFTGKEAQLLLEEGQNLIKIQLDSRSLADVECIATGVYSPLEGFLSEKDYYSVINNFRLENGIVWPIPVNLMISNEQATSINAGDQISLTFEDQVIAIMEVTDIFIPDKKEEAVNVYKTVEESHPGVSVIYKSGDVYLGGPIKLFVNIPHEEFHNFRLTPQQTREEFEKRGWRTVVAFQTRNPIHRAHEYLQKVALEMVDGLYINPLVGQTKSDDIPASVRMQTYEKIISEYYPKERVVLGVFPAAMRYAGPREAIMHAIARTNYGCSHFIVGRDHAGVGKYYGTYEAQEIFDQFTLDELAITPLKFEHAFFCYRCGQMVTAKTCPHTKENHVFLAGTKVRAMLFEGELPPGEFTRPEVAKILMDATKNQKVETAQQKGVTVWFTGLSGSGKSTIAAKLNEILVEKAYKTEILDGDIIRQNLTKGLGFSKEDRDENIRRIGFVAQLLTRNNTIVIAAAISPYREVRDEVRAKIGDFVEVYVSTPLEVCEKRDIKGLYKRARAGEIKQFTGIDDPYEEPLNPQVNCDAQSETVDECTGKVYKYLRDNGYVSDY